ncbi:unnamed protein product [Ectocarpus sp. 12 AP-2014]
MENLIQKMTLNRNRRNIKIIRLYIISLLCISCYFLMENYNVIHKVLQQWSTLRYNQYTSKFVAILFTGLLKYGLLIVGICIFSTLSFILIKEKLNK